MDFTTVFTFIKDALLSLLTLLMMLSPATKGDVEAYSAERPDDLITSFAVVSDIHVETNNPASYDNFSDVLHGLKAGEDIDAVIYTGDNVMNGQVTEDFLFYNALKFMRPAKHNLVVVGNHDVGNGEGDYDSLRKKFIANNALFLGNINKTDYYYKVINGCYMIVLSTEDNSASSFTMTEEQLEWLENVLKEAKEDNAKVFVFSHFPIRYLRNIAPDRLAGLLTEYSCELYVHGHIHDHLGRDNFYTSYGVDCINLPRVTETTDYDAGDGIVVEVYEDEIVVRGRDFISGEWIDGLRYSY